MKVISFEPQPKFRASHKSDNHFYMQHTVLVKTRASNAREAIVLRSYATNNATYCVLWITQMDHEGFALDEFVSSGKSVVVQSNRLSEAAFEAFKNMGVVFDQSWRGKGEQAIREALGAMAHYLDLDVVIIHSAHA